MEIQHPDRPCVRCKSVRFIEISHKLLKSESLDPQHSVRMEACYLCGKARAQDPSKQHLVE